MRWALLVLYLTAHREVKLNFLAKKKNPTDSVKLLLSHPFALIFSLASRTFTGCVAIRRYINPALQVEALALRLCAGSPACAGANQTAPRGFGFTPCQIGCVYSNVSNCLSICEANLLIVFVMMPWAAQGADL